MKILLFSILKAEVCDKLFDSLVSPIALHAAPIWSPLYLEKLQVIQNNYLRLLLHLPCNTPGYTLRHKSGIVSMEVGVFKLVLSFVEGVLKEFCIELNK